MKIIQLVTQRQARGAEMAAAALSEGLEKLGHQVFFISLFSLETSNELDVDCHQVVDLAGSKKPFLDINLLLKLRKLIVSIRPDIVQANGSDTFKYSTIALAFNPSIPIVYRNISLMSHWVNRRKVIKYFYRGLSKRIDHITSVSLSANIDVRNLLKYPESSSCVIKRGIEMEAIDKSFAKDSLLHQFGIDPNSRLIVQVGHLSPEKNHEMAIQILEQLSILHSDVKLLIVGGGHDHVFLERMIISKGLNEKVMLIGYQQRVDIFISAAEAVMLTSLIEGIPGVLIEAGAQSKPVVAINVGGVAEVISHGYNGYLVSQKEGVPTFVKYLDRLLKTPHQAELFGVNARKKFESNHSFNQFLNQFDSLYHKLVKN